MTTIEQSDAVRTGQGGSNASRASDQLLVWAATFFTLAVLFHNGDHTRRGFDSVGRDVFVLGTSAIALEVAIVVLAFQRHRLAPVVAAVSGFALAAGYVFVHFLPARTWLSDSFTSGHDVSALSWAAASLEVVAALTLGVVGLVVWLRRGEPNSATPARPAPPAPVDPVGFWRAARYPVPLAMILGNVAYLAITFWQA